LGIVARHKKIVATQLTKELQLTDEDRLRSYVNNLLEMAILITRGIKKATEYLINPKLVSSSKINIKPTLKIIEPHRLKALIEEDVKMYPNSKMSEIQKRLPAIVASDIQKCVYKLVNDGTFSVNGAKTNRTYSLA